MSRGREIIEVCIKQGGAGKFCKAFSRKICAEAQTNMLKDTRSLGSSSTWPPSQKRAWSSCEIEKSHSAGRTEKNILYSVDRNVAVGDLLDKIEFSIEKGKKSLQGDAPVCVIKWTGIHFLGEAIAHVNIFNLLFGGWKFLFYAQAGWKKILN